MIPVRQAPEPATFDAAVRQLGLSAIDEMVGRPPRLRHGGKKRLKIANQEKDIPAKEFPTFWRKAIPDLLTAYNRLCSFSALYIEPGTGTPSVDHMIPKSHRWDLVYEWANYRLCSLLINGCKTNSQQFVDPFRCKIGWFSMEFVGFQVVRGPTAPVKLLAAIDATLVLLNHQEFRLARQEHYESYFEGIPYCVLKRKAPFVAQEMARQGLLLPGD